MVMLDPRRIRPSWLHALWAIPALLFGIVLFVFFLFSGLSYTMGTLTQVVSPGQAVLNIERPGTYTIFLENPSQVRGRIYASTESNADLKCRLTQQLPSQTSVDSPQTEVALHPPSFNLNYSLGNRSGKSVLEFEANAQALYRLSCGYPDERPEPKVVLAVGTGVGKRILGTLIRSFLGLLTGVGLAAIVVIVVHAKREKVTRSS